MIHLERHSRIPRTSLDVLREMERGGVAVRIGGGSSLGGATRRREATAGEQDWSRIVAEQNVFQKQLVRKKARPELLYESEDEIKCDAEIHENYNGDGDLGIILEFTGIEFIKGSVQTSKHSRPDNPVLYIPVGHNERMVRLFLATRGDIFEFQIVPAQMDVQPFFFQQELYLPQLTTTHDPGSMYASQNNGIITVGYNPRAY